MQCAPSASKGASRTGGNSSKSRIIKAFFFADRKAAEAQASKQIRRIVVTIDLPFKTSVQLTKIVDLVIDHLFRFRQVSARRLHI
jgi:hypothetical protein